MEWRAAVTEDPMDFARGYRRLVLWRNYGDRVQVVTGFSEDGQPVMAEHEPGVAWDFHGFALPVEAVDSLGESLRPGPSRGEVTRLEDALAVERKRVDDVLAKIRDQP